MITQRQPARPPAPATDAVKPYREQSISYNDYVNVHLGPCQKSGLATTVAKRLNRCETAFETGYIESYAKRWLISHERSSRLPSAGETPVLT